MATVDNFIQKAKNDYTAVSFIDSLLSSPLIFIAKALFFLYAAGMISLAFGLAGMHGWKFLVIFFCALATAVVLSINAFGKIERNSPVRKKAFTYRIAQLVGYLKDKVANVEKSKNGVVLTMVGDPPRTLKISYTKNLLINAGGILPGTPLALPKPAHPKTFYFIIEGPIESLQEAEANFDFSARADDEDQVFGFGVRLYENCKSWLTGSGHVEAVNKETGEILGLKEKIREIIQGTCLKGEFELHNGHFIMRIFDPVARLTYGRGVFSFRQYAAAKILQKNGVLESNLAFYGIEKLLALVI